MERIRNDNWKEDDALSTYLSDKVRRNYKRVEILHEVSKKFPVYAWSMRTLATRLKYFDISYTNNSADLNRVISAVQQEVDGPGKKLGIRAMQQKVREIHKLNVPRNLVRDVMEMVDPEGLMDRGNVGKKKRERNKRFQSAGPNHTLSMDGHDKLCGWQKSTFPLCIYGAQDCYSGKLVFLRIWTSNNKPEIIGRYYLEYLKETKKLPCFVRVDGGTETDIMASVHGLFHMQRSGETVVEASDRVFHGPSTQNKIERWRRELHHRLGKFFKEQLNELLENGHYDRLNNTHRGALAYIYIPLIQKALDEFSTVVWNHGRGRLQPNKDLPTGRPSFLYENPEYHQRRDYATILTEDECDAIIESSELFENDHEYLEDGLRPICERLVPDPALLDYSDAPSAYISLRDHLLEYLESLSSR